MAKYGTFKYSEKKYGQTAGPSVGKAVDSASASRINPPNNAAARRIRRP